MYRAKLLFYLVLGPITHLMISAKNADSELSKPKNPSNEMSLDIFGKPLSEVEESVKRFLLTLSKPTSKSLTQTLEKTSLKGENIKDLVTISTKLVIENLRSCSRDLGILKNENLPEIIAPDENENLTNNLIQNGLLLICEVINMLLTGSSLGLEFLFGNQTSVSKFTNFNLKNPGYRDIIIFTDELFIYLDCMTQDFTINGLEEAVHYGSKHSTKEVITYLKKKLKKPPSNRRSDFCQSICSAIENIKPGGYEKCVSDWDKIQSCFESRTKTSSKSRGFFNYMKQLFPRKWVNSVVDLDRSCKLKKDQNFECKIRRRPASTLRQVEHIIKSFTGKSITRTSSLSKVIRQFSRVISKSPVAKSIVQDCSDHISIFQQGENRKRDLKKKSEMDPKELRKYRKVSKSLAIYQKGVIQDLLNAIVESNQIPIYVEKSLRKATPKWYEWPLFTTTLVCLAVWINSLFDNKNNKTGTPIPMSKFHENQGVYYDRNSQVLIEIHEEFPDLKKHVSKEQALDSLLRTMNQVSSENRGLVKNSAFTGGLNNILLLLMFLETLSAVTLLMTTNMQLMNGAGSGQSGHNGQSGQSGQMGQIGQGVSGGNGASNQETSEEDLRRKKRSFDLDYDITYVSDLPDIGILPLNSSIDFLNDTNYENGMNDTNDLSYEIRESMVIKYENISVSRTKTPKFDDIVSFEDYSYSWEFNETLLKD